MALVSKDGDEGQCVHNHGVAQLKALSPVIAWPMMSV